MESEVVPRKPYPTGVTDEEWAFVALYLTLMAPDAPQRRHDLRALLRWSEGRADAPTAVILDTRTIQSTPESGGRAGWDGHKRRKGSKTHAAVDTLGHPLALRVTPADAQEREQVGALAAGQEATGENVEVAFVDQGTRAMRRRRRRPPTASAWRPSSCRRPGGASSCCPGTGSWSAASPVPRDSTAWPATTNGCPKRSPACISWPSPA
jgi:transposase